MAGGQLHTLIRHLRHVVHPSVADGLTDAQLLQRFVQERDQAAFEVLVWRHGPMVHSVCLRLLHREHDAEDAFQATFLALVRKAGAISKRESLASWLYKVAYRVALRARTTAPVRSLPAEPLWDPAAGEPLAHVLDRELASVLDEEVQRLPDRYRAVFVLCQLQGQTIEAAGRILGCPPGTVGTRMARARELLRRRLADRGYAAGPLAVPARAALPPALAARTIQAALLRTPAQAVAAGVISAHVADLTKGVLRTMFLTRWTPVAAICVISLSLCGAVALLVHRTQAVEPAPVQVARDPDPKEEPSGAVLRWKFVKDQPFYQEMTTETSQVMKVMQQDVVQQQKQTFYFRWTPLRQHAGKWDLEQKIEGVKMDVEIGGNKTTYDSTQGSPPAGPLADFYKALVGAEFTVTVNRQNQVQQVGGRDELIRKLVASNPSLEKVLTQVLSEDAVHRMAEIPFAGMPPQSVQPGDSWTEERELPLGEYEAKYRYTYTGRTDKLDRIEIKVSVPPNDKGEKGEVRSAEGTGTLLFDRATGRGVRLELTVKVEGRMTQRIGGKDEQVEVVQTQKIIVKTMDTDPLAATRPQGDAKDREIERLREENARLRRQLQAVEEALRGEQKP